MVGIAPGIDADDMHAPAETAVDPNPASRRRYLTAFVVMVVVLVIVLAMLPAAISSMIGDLRGEGNDQAYDLFTGAPVDHDAPIPDNITFVNIAITSLNEANGTATLILSGHRTCPTPCPPFQATFYSLGNDAARRHGLPPSATVDVPADPGSYTFAIDLPLHGTSQNYPFDKYTLTLGVVIALQLPNGAEQLINSREVLLHSAMVTLEDRVARLNMNPPQTIDPATARAPGDPFAFLVVDQLTWERPLHLRILAALLVVLITVSGIFALGLRSLHELVLGIGGIILGIWGVRSIVVQSQLPDVTLIDLVLGFVILLLLVGLAIRATAYFYVKSGLRLRK